MLWAIPAALLPGFFLGRGVGRLAIFLRSRHRDTTAPSDFLALALFLLSYVFAETIGAWGFLAVFAAGVGLRGAEINVVRHSPHPEHRRQVEESEDAGEIPIRRRRIWSTHACIPGRSFQIRGRRPSTFSEDLLLYGIPEWRFAMSLAEWLKFVPPPRPLEAGEKWNVFLSYRSANRAWVMNLYDVLRVHGHQVFLDQCVLAAGDELIPQLQTALRQSQAGVLVWSNATRDSKWVSREYQVMERLTDSKPSFRFVPVRLDSSELPEFGANRIFLDFQAYPDGPNGGELLRLLHAVVGKPLSAEAARFALEQDELSSEASAQITAALKRGSPERLVELFEAGGLAWESSATLGAKVAEGLTKLDRYDLALDVLEKLSRQFPRAIRPKQLRALALNRRARGGAVSGDADIGAAQDILGVLYERNERDPETLGIYGATWMERYRRSKDLRHLRQSRDLYMEAFESAQDDYYTGINAAAKSVLIGGDEEVSTGATLAARVQQIVGTEPRKGDYWFTATIGEVFLIRKQYAEAGRLYAAAVATAPTEEGSHKSTWTQACALMEKLQPSAAERAAVRQAFAHLPDCEAG